MYCVRFCPLSPLFLLTFTLPKISYCAVCTRSPIPSERSGLKRVATKRVQGDPGFSRGPRGAFILSLWFCGPADLLSVYFLDVAASLAVESPVSLFIFSPRLPEEWLLFVRSSDDRITTRTKVAWRNRKREENYVGYRKTDPVVGVVVIKLLSSPPSPSQFLISL